MRYFILFRPASEGVRPYILAEVVRETSDDGRYREWSAAAGLAGEHCEILTRNELLERSDGARALMAWETLDDRQFDVDTQRIVEQIEIAEREAVMSGRHLRVVPDEIETPPNFDRANRRLQWIAARRRTLMLESVRLRSDAQELIAKSRERRGATSPEPKPTSEGTG